MTNFDKNDVNANQAKNEEENEEKRWLKKRTIKEKNPK